MVYWNSNEIVVAVIGGALMALASSLNFYFMGRITGISGMLNSMVKDEVDGYYWRASFFMGMITIPFVTLISGSSAVLIMDTMPFE